MFKGVDFRNPNLTRNPKIWWRFICWYISFWMMFHKPRLPQRIRFYFRRVVPNRYSMTWGTIEGWKSIDPNYTPKIKPLPWPICAHADGPFLKPWNRMQAWFSGQTGGLSHRCEFTDVKHGLLYNPEATGFMEVIFERFIENISADD